MWTSQEKANVMKIGPPQEKLDCHINGLSMEQVFQLAYLGAVVSEDGRLRVGSVFRSSVAENI